MNAFWVIAGIIFVSILGTLSHFTYQWSGKNRIVGFLTPVNESVWEHMKLLFFPMLLYGLLVQGNQADPCRTAAYCAGLLIGTLLIPVIFYAYTAVLGKNYLPLDILTFLVSVVAAFLFYAYFAAHGTLCDYDRILTAAVFLLLIFFLVFTYFPPHFFLFDSPESE